MVGTSGVLMLGAAGFVLAILFQRRLMAVAAGWTSSTGAKMDDLALGGNPFAGFSLVARSPYLLLIALFVVLLSAVNTFLYFEQLKQVAELYDPYSINTAWMIEQAGFCSPGISARLEREGAWECEGGQVAINPSGGTLCTNPIAVSGLVRAIDAANQIMGRAGTMQLKNIRNALATSSGGTGQFCCFTVFGIEPFEA